LAAWIAAQPPACDVVIVGGGELADAIRRLDRLHDLGASSAHWLCIRVLSLQAELAHELLRRERSAVALVRRFADLRSATSGDVVVFDPEPFLRGDEPRFPGAALRQGWHVTSDSIAARLAECLNAIELAVLKSAAPPVEDHAALAEIGYVDGFFPIAARTLPRVRFVNLRAGCTELASAVNGLGRSSSLADAAPR
jgi:aspartokinase-like uncharacterized kinase